jgi:hypothetical protein
VIEIEIVVEAVGEVLVLDGLTTPALLTQLLRRDHPALRENDVAVERLNLDPRAAVSEREVEALAPTARGLTLRQLNRKISVEIPLKRAHEHRRVGCTAKAHADIAAVRCQPVGSLFAHCPVEGDIAVDR